jgi:CheY-like chemotaxis protein
VVDDDEQVRSLTSETLQTLGYDVLQADSGQTALHILARTRPNAVLLDYAMPGMNGAETARRALERWPGLPIVLASGYADTQAVEAALGEDAVMLKKPFDIGALGAAIDQSLRRAPG